MQTGTYIYPNDVMVIIRAVLIPNTSDLFPKKSNSQDYATIDKEYVISTPPAANISCTEQYFFTASSAARLALS